MAAIWKDLTRDWSRWSRAERMAAMALAASPTLLLLSLGAHALT